MSHDDISEQLRAAEEAEERRKFSKKEIARVEERITTPKPDPFESDARAELRQEQNRIESKITEEKPVTEGSREQLNASYQEMKKARSPRDRDLMEATGKRVLFHLRWRQGPRITGKLVAIDWDKASLKIETEPNSKSTIVWVQMSDIIRWELWQE